jgi:hypothetical protein
MKHIVKKLFVLFLPVSLLLASCSQDKNLPGPTVDSGLTFTIDLNENSDGNIIILSMKDLNLSFHINHIEGDYSETHLMYSINEDFSKQYALNKINSFPADIETTINDLVSTNNIFTDTTDIIAGTIFTFFVNATNTNNVPHYGIHPKTGMITQSSARKNLLENKFKINIVAAPPFVPSNFVGAYKVRQIAPWGTSNYTSMVSIDPDKPENGLICTNIGKPGDETFPSATKVYVDLETFAVLGDNQTIWFGSLYKSVVGLRNFSPGLCNTATSSFWFTAEYGLPDIPYWYGVVKWELTPIN